MNHPHQPERIAVGTDGSLSARAATRWAIHHSQAGDTVTLVHSWEPAPATAEPIGVGSDPFAAAKHFIERECARASALAHPEGVSICGEVIQGDPKDCLGKFDCDLLVVGARGHSRVAELLLGSVTAHLSHHCRHPLVIVPHESGRLPA